MSGKAAHLDTAAAVGLDVPAGLVVLDGTAVTESLMTGIDRWCSRRSIGCLAVRSAFGAEDAADASRAGWFETQLGVAPADVAQAIGAVRASADRLDHDDRSRFRRDVLVMTMVDARRSGVAFTESGTYDDVVNVVDGLADRLVGGETAGRRVLLPRLESADAGWERRLQELLAEVREVFGDRAWDVEWADDGTTCWLLQVRPITAPTLRDELLTLANHAEILPSLPSTLMTSVIDRAGPDLFAWYRARVPGLPADRDFLHVVAGRPMINLSLLEDMMRHLGLPTALVADSIGGEGGVDRPADPVRLVRRSPSLVRLGLAQVAAVAFARRNERRVAAIGAGGAQSFGEALDQLHEAYVTLVTGMFPLSSAIGPPLALLRRAGTLHDHASTHRTVTTELSDRRREVAAAPSDERHRLAAHFLADFGHRGVYESDIARPRYADEPDRLDAREGAHLDTAATAFDRAPPRRSPWWWLTRPIWLLAARPLAARERFRHEAMRSFASIRSSIVVLARRAHLAGQLPDPDAVWLLDVGQLRSLDDGAVVEAEAVAAAHRERERLAELHPPHVVHRFADPASWSVGAGHEVDGDRWCGLPLTAGTITGRAWVLDEPASELPDGFEPGTTVLVARSIDAGWIDTLALVAAAVIEIGGDLSHGSILVRELGIPAVTNVRGVRRVIADGDELTVDAGGGVVRRSR